MLSVVDLGILGTEESAVSVLERGSGLVLLMRYCRQIERLFLSLHLLAEKCTRTWHKLDRSAESKNRGKTPRLVVKHFRRGKRLRGRGNLGALLRQVAVLPRNNRGLFRSLR